MNYFFVSHVYSDGRSPGLVEKSGTYHSTKTWQEAASCKVWWHTRGVPTWLLTFASIRRFPEMGAVPPTNYQHIIRNYNGFSPFSPSSILTQCLGAWDPPIESMWRNLHVFVDAMILYVSKLFRLCFLHVPGSYCFPMFPYSTLDDVGINSTGEDVLSRSPVYNWRPSIFFLVGGLEHFLCFHCFIIPIDDHQLFRALMCFYHWLVD